MKIRFRRGDWTCPGDVLIMAATRSSFVHAEIKDNNVAWSAYEDAKPCCFQSIIAEEENDRKWFSIEIPLRDEAMARRFLSEMGEARVAYQMETRSVLPTRVIRFLYGGVDCDCEKPETWNTCYCSQAILLWLRRCAKDGILLASRNMDDLWSMHSRACYPRRLYLLTKDLFLPASANVE